MLNLNSVFWLSFINYFLFADIIHSGEAFEINSEVKMPNQGMILYFPLLSLFLSLFSLTGSQSKQGNGKSSINT